MIAKRKNRFSQKIMRKPRCQERAVIQPEWKRLEPC